MKFIPALSKLLKSLVEGRGYFEELQTAMHRKDAAQVEKVVREAWKNEETDEIVPLMGALCMADWHSIHEDAVGLLQKFGDVDDVPALEYVAGSSHSYLAYDEHFGLARKATWALADIGGNEARQALARIAVWSNPIIAGYADKRLLRWDIENNRKRN
jgi:hypothetical protein